MFTPESHISLSSELRNEILSRNILTARTRNKVLYALDDIARSSADSKRSTLREKCIEEIYSSEKTYMHQLNLILKYFITPLREKKLLPYDVFTTIFGNIDTIFNVNIELLKQLELNLSNVAEAFLKIAPFFKLYSVYAYDYKKSLMLLQEQQINNPEFSKFLEHQESCSEVSTKLSALLITPIQRVPRYRLLLKQLLGYTMPSDPDHRLLTDSLNEVERAAFHINSLVQEQESTQRLLELQRSLCSNKPNIVKPGRRLLKEGLVMKMAQNGSHGCPRYFILMSDIIMYCKLVKNKPTEPNSLFCCCILPLHKCRITEIASKGVFTITCQNEALMFYCDSASEVEEWINVLQKAISRYIECRKTLRKDSSSRQPIRRRNLVDFDQETISPGQCRRKRRQEPLKPEFDDVLRIDDETSEPPTKSNKRFKINKPRSKHCNENKDILFPLRNIQNLETISAGKQLNTNAKNDDIQTFGLQKQVNNQETAIMKLRGYLYNLGKSLKSVFHR